MTSSTIMELLVFSNTSVLVVFFFFFFFFRGEGVLITLTHDISRSNRDLDKKFPFRGECHGTRDEIFLSKQLQVICYTLSRVYFGYWSLVVLSQALNAKKKNNHRGNWR